MKTAEEILKKTIKGLLEHIKKAKEELIAVEKCRHLSFDGADATRAIYFLESLEEFINE